MVYPPPPPYRRGFDPGVQLAGVNQYRNWYPALGGGGRPRGTIYHILMCDPALIAEGDFVSVFAPGSTAAFQFDKGTLVPAPGATVVDISGAVTADDVAIAFSAVSSAVNWYQLALLGPALTYLSKRPGTGTISTTCASIDVSRINGTFGDAIIPVRWGLSRGVQNLGELTS